MTIIKEFRIPLPISVDEYKIAQLYSVADASKNETGGNDGIEVKVNEPKDGGQYTHKIFHLESKVPGILNRIAPAGSLKIDEKALNAYPYCVTKYDQPYYMKEAFEIIIISIHKPLERDSDGNLLYDDKVHENEDDLKKYKKKDYEAREIDYIDIVNDSVSSADYKEDEDPSKFHSVKTGRGPLTADWLSNPNQGPMMCCYKLYIIKFHWTGLTWTIEPTIKNNVRRILHNFHRQVFCWMDKWYGLTIEDIRAYEAETKEALDVQRATGEKRGMVAD